MTSQLTRYAALLAASCPALAGGASPELMLDTVVVSGSRIAQRSFDLPAAIDVIDAARIGADQARVNASEALAAIPGISIQNRENYAQDLQISSRGFGSRAAFGVRGLRLIADGIPASMPDGQGQAASFNLDRAERIEVLRGPLSAVYGNHAGGVIQLFTPDGKGAPSLESRVLAGSNASWKADVSAQGEHQGIGYVLDTSRFATNGYREHSAAQRDQSLIKLTAKPSPDSKLTVLANNFRQDAEDPQGLRWNEYQERPRGLSWDAGNQIYPALAYNTRKSISQQQGGLSFEQQLGVHTLFLSAYTGQRATTQYQSIPRSTQLISAGTAATAPVRKQAGGMIDFERDYAGLSGRWSSRLPLAGGQLTTTIGVDYEQASDDRRGYENYIGNTLGVRGSLRRSEEDRVSSFDQYAQAEWQRGDWSLSGGLRHSRLAFKVDDRFIATGNGNDSGQISYEKSTPNLAALLRLTPAINLYVSAAKGFEAPTFNEMFYSSGGGSFNFALKPSTSTHYEAGIKALLGDDSRLDLAVFQIETRDELVVLASSGGRTAYQNAGETLRRGLELAADSRWPGQFTSRIAYTLLDATYDKPFSFMTAPPNPLTQTIPAGKHLPGVAAHNLFGELAWRHLGSGFHAAIEGIARSKVYVEDSNTQQAAPGYALANLRIGIGQHNGPLFWQAFLRLNNLFDRQYVGSVIVGESNGRYYESAPGRNWLAGVSARYTF